MTEESIAPDGRPTVQPLTRADWRAWLLEHHSTSPGVWLVGYRRGSGKPRLEYEDVVEELLCVGWIDSTGGYLDEQRTRLWVCPRRPRSVWSQSNRARVERLTTAGLMLPAGLAAVDDAKRRGTWTALDAVADLSVPDDLAAALEANPPAREAWDRVAPSTRRMILWWILSAKRPETRAARVAETARRAHDGEPLDRTRRRA